MRAIQILLFLLPLQICAQEMTDLISITPGTTTMYGSKVDTIITVVNVLEGEVAVITSIEGLGAFVMVYDPMQPENPLCFSRNEIVGLIQVGGLKGSNPAFVQTPIVIWGGRKFKVMCSPHTNITVEMGKARWVEDK